MEIPFIGLCTFSPGLRSCLSSSETTVSSDFRYYSSYCKPVNQYPVQNEIYLLARVQLLIGMLG